ncbi:MAG: hypothetical protein MSIBF_00305 [Candidatus Altiarchaeales archaeon IMC4]|nr:MAG: hypothetical protein MSIBF_00305 [Candidatus Altiarchaeales archaeon IMC4]
MNQLKPAVMIGKNGVTETVISEIRLQIAKNRKIKVKILGSAKEGTTCKEIAEEVAGLTRTKLVDVRGNTFVISK